MTHSLIALIATGGNQAEGKLGLRSSLEKALDRLRVLSNGRIIAQSRWYGTPAWPKGSGPDFLNGALALEFTGTPLELIAHMHAVEAEFGRRREIRWGPRTCDLDLIGIDDLVLPNLEAFRAEMERPDAEAQASAPDELLLPHPRMHKRGFVLVPLCDVAPDWRHPVLGRTVRELCDDLPEEETAQVRPQD